MKPTTCCLCGLCLPDDQRACEEDWIPEYVSVAGKSLPPLPETAPPDNTTGPVCVSCQQAYLEYNDEFGDYELKRPTTPAPERTREP